MLTRKLAPLKPSEVSETGVSGLTAMVNDRVSLKAGPPVSVTHTWMVFVVLALEIPSRHVKQPMTAYTVGPIGPKRD